MHTLSRVTVTLLTVVALTPISPAQAADARTTQALDRIEAGTWSSADLALIRSQPEVAGP